MTMRLRREPPQFRHVRVHEVANVTPRLARITLAGPEFVGFAIDAPAASVRLLLPSRGTAELVVPVWNGNEFLLPDGSRPVIRTLTPRRADPAAGTLDIEIVLHGEGAASQWAASVAPGSAAAISGPGRGYEIATDATAFLVAGDETALPAMSQLLEALPHEARVDVTIEVAHPDARFELPRHPRATLTWLDLADGDPPGARLVAAMQAATIPSGARGWVAGEAAAVQRIRKLLFTEGGIPRPHATVRGYWKHGRRGDDADD